MIGRTSELSVLTRLIDTMTTAGHAVVIAGEAGIGKTTLAEAVAEHARAAGFRELRCTGYQSEATPGFAGLHELLYPVWDEGSSLPDRQRAALQAAFGLADDAGVQDLLVALAALGILEDAASEQPVLLYVEDLQWLDASSAAVIKFLARRLTNAPILLLVTVRAEDPEIEIPWAPAEAVLPLAPLTRAESDEVLEHAGVALSEGERKRILDEAGGNPLALRELPVAVREHGDAVGLLPGVLPTSRRLESAFLGQAAHLPDGSRRLLVVAACGEDMPLPELVAAARELGLTREDLDPLEKSGLLTLSGDRLRFRHPLVRSAVYGAASSRERTAAHLALAAAAHDPGRAAWHRAAGSYGRDEALAAELEAAGQTAARHGARSEAAAALHKAAEVSPRVDDRVRRLSEAAELARRAGEPDAVWAMLREAVPVATEPDTIVQLASTEVGTSLASGVPARSIRELLVLVRRLAGPDGSGHPEARVRLLWAMALECVDRARSAEETAAVARELAAIDLGRWDPVQEIARALVDPAGRVDVLKPKLRSLVPLVGQDMRVLLSLGHAAFVLHDLPAARLAWAAGCDYLPSLGSSVDEAQLLATRASTELLLGRLQEAQQRAELGLRIAGHAGLPAVAAAAEAASAYAFAWRSEMAEAAAAVRRSRRLSTEAPRGHETALAAWAAGLVAFHAQRYEEAWTELMQVQVFPPLARMSVADLTEVALRSGKAGDAEAFVARVEADARVFDSPHLRTVVHRSRALLLDGPEAAGHYELALEHGRRSEARMEVARTQLAYGEWLRRRRRIAQAREHLTAASKAFEDAGARGWAARAAAELTAAGGTPATAASRAGAQGGLTPQELQIALLAAEGLTNKEIADRLYLSHRTVGAHLHKVFPKLGITARTQLRDVLETPSDT
ncbi:AAA family ATPase [Amycolatopsis sp. A133]|uniref:helix-turn-helix transcriptional regulator n=1 Tax=Amycolatopsis sp. A133 TaxID=3064472 RepID=UPI0027F57D6E|nr:AAA family ATPase [Amycolatopsis sp. A133]MDQ7809787.1 AAA family ATPase [Amycolatopsis sp. A133]